MAESLFGGLTSNDIASKLLEYNQRVGMQQTPVQQQQPINTDGNPFYKNNPKPIIGHCVSDPTEITPSEVPMDGTVAIFPMTNYSSIYAKMWNSNGQIQTVRFIPEVDDPAESDDINRDELASTLALLGKSIQTVGDKVNKIEKMLYKNRSNKTYSKNKDVTTDKGDVQNE